VEDDKLDMGLVWRMFARSALESMEAVRVIIMMTIEDALLSVWKFVGMMLDSIGKLQDGIEETLCGDDRECSGEEERLT
jgi:hypothetical protein